MTALARTFGQFDTRDSIEGGSRDGLLSWHVQLSAKE